MEIAPQNFLQHIVVDSSPDTHAILREEFHAVARKWVHQEPRGVYAAINFGSQLANAKLLLHLNAGDVIVSPDSFLRAVEQFETNDLDLIFSPGALFRQTYFAQTPTRKSFRSNLIGDNSICHPGVIIKRDTFLDMGSFNESLRLTSEYHFWIRVANSSMRTRFFPEIFAGFELGGLSSIHASKTWKEAYRSSRMLRMGFWDKVRNQISFRWLILKSGLLVPALKATGLFPAVRWAWNYIDRVRDSGFQPNSDWPKI